MQIVRPEDIIQVKFVEIWKPQTLRNDDLYTIDQELTLELGYEDQFEVEESVIERMNKVSSKYLNEIDFESNEDSFVVHAKNEEAILAVANAIVDLKNRF